MKTQTSRSQFSALFCAVLMVVGLTFALPSKTFGQGVVNISVHTALGPDTVTQPFVNDAVYALMNGVSSYGLWNEIPSGSSTDVTQIFTSNGVGNDMYYGLAITSTQPFKLGDVQFNASSSIFNLTASLRDVGFSYALQGIGINGSTIYNSDNVDTPVYGAYIIGLGYSINTTGQTFEQALENIQKVSPFTDTTTYSYGGASGSASQTFTVTQAPEPATFALFGLGAGLVLMRKFRNKF